LVWIDFDIIQKYVTLSFFSIMWIRLLYSKISAMKLKKSHFQFSKFNFREKKVSKIIQSNSVSKEAFIKALCCIRLHLRSYFPKRYQWISSSSCIADVTIIVSSLAHREISGNRARYRVFFYILACLTCS